MSEIKTISELKAAFAGLKVLVIGDVMLDRYVYGHVGRISPEAPVPVVHVKRREKRLGGAGNVARNLNALGATSVLCSVVGDDHEANEFLDILREERIDASGIIRSQERITTVKERVMAGSQHIVRVDSENDHELTGLEQRSLVQHIQRLAGDCDVVIFEDYDKGTLNTEVIRETVAFCLEQGIPTVVDPKKRNFLSYAGVSLFKPNLKELREGLQVEIESGNLEQVAQAVARLKAQMPFEKALITLSEHGVYVEDRGEQVHIPAHIRKIADVSGAGDTVVSIAALALALKLPMHTIASLANLGGGLVCEHLGVVPIDLDQLMAEAVAESLFSES